jgi:mannose-1-phosphate guanylyltransferase/mannose-6-phosphate isomerase
MEKPPTKLIHRPWGGFTQYAHNQATTVSLMIVEPHQRLSLQAHAGRGELWIVFDDGASVQLGEDLIYPKPGDEIWIPANTKHRLSSLGSRVRVLEVAFGDWQQEDITRFDDDYGRPEQGE